ncbi:hypothetical protein B0H21DRAFT_688963 [Amylocystis lapponica]|nr:hypothetical protein B0H21DRAFT_688963 [Amylocystis lapponica]
MSAVGGEVPRGAPADQVQQSTFPVRAGSTRPHLGDVKGKGRVNRLVEPSTDSARESAGNVPRKTHKAESAQKRRREGGGPVRKRPRVVLSESESEAEGDAEEVRGRREGRRDKAVRARADRPAPVKRKGENGSDENRRETARASKKTAGSASASLGESSMSRRTSRHSRSRDSRPPALAPLPSDELQGMLIESLATSRASSLPASSLYSALIASRPTLKDAPHVRGDGKMSKSQWMCVIEDALEEGRRACGVFAKVESTVERDAADHPLEAQWFYVPENDADQERATLIRSMMPRPAKRTATKKYKQYYWRPLGKISRWDPEDEM